MNLQAHLEPATTASTDRRNAARRKLKFGARLAKEGAGVIIRDLSTAGLRFETSATLECGERIDVLLPEKGATQAVVIWCDGQCFGGKFTEPVSKATVSAALLLSEPASERPRAPLAGPDEGGEPTTVAYGRSARGALIWTAVAVVGAVLLLALGYLSPIGALTALASVALVAALLLVWGFWVLDNTIEL